MRSFFVLSLALALLAATPGSAAPTVAAVDGAIVIQQASGPVRLTEGPHDSAPVLSPDGRLVAFLRTPPGKTLAAGSGEVPARELWLVPSTGGGGRRLVAPRAAAEPRRLLAGMQSLCFSPDGRELYFESAAWATSGAIHGVSLANGRLRFIIPGNSLAVVPSGQYRGCLIVSQHRYLIGGGSYDWFWLFRPTGREVGPLGESVENFRSTEGFGEKPGVGSPQ